MPRDREYEQGSDDDEGEVSVTTSATEARLPASGDSSDIVRQIVSLGSHVVIEDLDDSTREEFVLVSSVESDPAEGWLSNESPVGRAIEGHRTGDVVDAYAPRRVRHLRIVDLSAGRN